MLPLLINCAVFLNGEESKPFFFSRPGFVSASGKWKPLSGKPSDDLPSKHAVEIQCRLETKQCFEATAQLVGGEP
jgi:hypothetical protein